VFNILLVGQDHRLLTTRAAVLKKTGAEVASCSTSEAQGFVESQSFELVVLCHSVLAGEAEMIADSAHKHSDKTRVLMVISSLSLENLGDVAKFDAVTSPDPGRLIARTTELLRGLPDHHLREFVNVQQRAAGL
jgi:DNA-binding response OmpR family regulator